MQNLTRRQFFQQTTRNIAAGSISLEALALLGQPAGERPQRAGRVRVLNPRGRVPVGWILDDSTCLVNLNRFAMPQFDQTFQGANAVYRRNWKDWPVEIPDAFVRKFGEWCGEHGIKGKYSVVPYPACVGRLDRFLPGWTQRELNSSIELVRSLLTPHWDIHPEMVTHTRVIDLRTGHPYPESTSSFMENWDWTTGRSVEEMTDYLRYALQILKNVGLPCEGITTPGGFGNRARPQLAQGTLRAVRDVFGAEIPHYFRDLYDSGETSVAPRVEYASGLGGPDPRCVVSILGCTGDWTGGWDCTPPEGADRFITEDLQKGRMVEVIERGEPALMVGHWTGIYWNGEELGFKILQEVARRLHQRFQHLVWMKLSEVARYWAARELTSCQLDGTHLTFDAPFACPDFTFRIESAGEAGVSLEIGETRRPLAPVRDALALKSGTCFREGSNVSVCVDLPKGRSRLQIG